MADTRPDERRYREKVTDLASSNRIAVLDGYRALAVMLVLFFHYTVRWTLPYDASNHLPSGGVFSGITLFQYGWIGVELFFVISGFVILMTLERCKSVTDFAMRRFARLWPPLFAAASLTALIVWTIGPSDWRVSWESYLSSILLVNPALVGKLTHHPHMDWVDGAYWSLWVEVRFYALACLCYWIARRKFVRLWLVLQLAVTALTLWSGGVASPKLNAWLELVIFLPFFPYFTIGTCLYEIYSGGPLRRDALAGIILAGLTVIYSAGSGANIYAPYNPIICVAANAMILGLFFLFAAQSPIVSLFQAKPIVVLGQASYSLYLIHQFIGISLMRMLMATGLPYLVALPATIAAVIALALCLFYVVEIPAKAFLLRQTRGWINSTGNSPFTFRPMRAAEEPIKTLA